MTKKLSTFLRFMAASLNEFEGTFTLKHTLYIFEALESSTEIRPSNKSLRKGDFFASLDSEPGISVKLIDVLLTGQKIKLIKDYSSTDYYILINPKYNKSISLYKGQLTYLLNLEAEEFLTEEEKKRHSERMERFLNEF